MEIIFYRRGKKRRKTAEGAEDLKISPFNLRLRLARNACLDLHSVSIYAVMTADMDWLFSPVLLSAGMLSQSYKIDLYIL